MELLLPLLSRYSPLFFFTFLVFSLLPWVRSNDAEALLALKSSIDPSKSLQWQGSVCQWQGIRECMNGRVTKLVLENLNLNGTLDERSLNQLDQLRVLSFKENSISGQIPNLSGLVNLKSLFLNNNNFSGDFPTSISLLHRLKVVVLSGNQISGIIPDSLLKLRRLYVLYLQDNRFTGEIPPLNQTSLRFLNLSHNQLWGEIPLTPALVRFNASSFSGNMDLCGEQIQNSCNGLLTPNSISPTAYPPVPTTREMQKHRRKRWKLIAIIAGSIGGFVLLLLVVLMVLILFRKRYRQNKSSSKTGDVRDVNKEGRDIGVEGGGSGGDQSNNNGNGHGRNKQRGGGASDGFSWEGGGGGGEGGGLGSLVFLGAGNQQMSYSLEDLLKASAETLGRGTMGSTYKAVMESGFIVTVKRLKDARYPRQLDEFGRQMELLGTLTHPNVVPLRAYFQAKEERLLVYDYFPNGSLFSLIHGSRASSGGKPLHWTSCLKIAEDLATGLLYIHQNPGLTHGNLKSSNVLLGSDFESCLTDYGLTSFKNPESHEESSASSLFYRAPECRDIRKPPTQQADIYSFGVLLLELLTGKTPFQDLVQEHGSDISRWVRSVREEETESGDDPASSNEASEEKLGALLSIAVACVSLAPENRPVMREVLRMIRETRAEAQVSSNSSDHSPGRWSDTVQSLPREEHLSI
ncbi:inactive leucine-rich repeat receptor-like serine/threonine-protein kinase At1g60630 [Cornus florida]|uniref:inactive leucine-rich repeat receptor-like serine/threonine-protein kinase At1g60630 n=1 Tax=Cornus florida TaxID=4283 RepID=UPI0028A08B87|nr:inactive leucine-rich repeat receptor-like serine/threonine-protein kinase At1g60630 [Cornus florida]